MVINIKKKMQMTIDKNQVDQSDWVDRDESDWDSSSDGKRKRGSESYDDSNEY